MTRHRMLPGRLLVAVLALAATASGLAAATQPAAVAGVAGQANPAAIIIGQSAAGQPYQPVDPYPSEVTISGADGPVSDVDVVLSDVRHGVPDDLDVLLVSPAGTAVLLVSDACGLWNYPVRGANWIVDDEAGRTFPDYGTCGSGFWRPANYEVTDLLPSPAPSSAASSYRYPSTLSAFDGENPNGTWRLFVYDDTGWGTSHPEDHGVIFGGFRLAISTVTRSTVIPPGPTGSGTASPYPIVVPVSGQVGRIEDVYVYLHGLAHSYPDDLDILLVAPGGQTIMLASDVCGGIPTTNTTTWRINDDDPPLPDEGDCRYWGAGGAGVGYGPTDFEPGEVLPAPAPAGPYGTALSVLDGTDPNGDWRVYVSDDRDRGSGFLRDVQLSFDLTGPVAGPPDTAITQHPATDTRLRRAQFAFTATESPVAFQCRRDDGAWRSCTSPTRYEHLAAGRHVFRVRAVDPEGAQDPTPARFVWRIRR